MSRYKFKWTNLDANMLRGLCRDLDLDVGDPAESLRSYYGARPTDDFVREAWPSLLERWLATDGPSRRRVVDDLWAEGLVVGDQPANKAEQMSFLRARNNARRLRKVVLDAFVAVGETTTVIERSTPTSEVAVVDVVVVDHVKQQKKTGKKPDGKASSAAAQAQVAL